MNASRRSLQVYAALAVLAGTGYAAADEAAPLTSAPRAEPIPCLERPMVVSYLHQLQDSVMAKWVIAEDTLSDQAVDVRFQVVADGRLKNFAVVSWSNHRLKNGVELAFAHAEPPGPVPETAACLIDRHITMRFENPY